MEIIYLRKFQKDIESLPSEAKIQLKKIIFSCKEAGTIRELPSLKKLTSYSSAYRIRMGNYRIGIFIENNIIEFARIAHRKDIYKLFP
ncbi:MAG: type II toxin-antitoxin system RelE/ParE family toxin [Dysgonamonadaceae bacterium]|jgi:mRNA interferase RelE/StbE|nr:type II toxin-antitoxin system RelE/ParE family toxin [Dysgonamonadaceae bacterium]